MYLCISSSEYEEDFEADDDGPVDAAMKEKKSPSSFSENQNQVKERDAFETEDDEKDGGWSLVWIHLSSTAWEQSTWDFKT